MHRRRKIALRRTGIAASLLLSALWIANAWCDLHLCIPLLPNRVVGLSFVGGTTQLRWNTVPHDGALISFESTTFAFFEWCQWGFFSSKDGSGFQGPTWLLSLTVLVITTAPALRTGETARSYQLGQCQHCGYDRANLRWEQPCPECGAPR